MEWVEVGANRANYVFRLRASLLHAAVVGAMKGMDKCVNLHIKDQEQQQRRGQEPVNQGSEHVGGFK